MKKLLLASLLALTASAPGVSIGAGERQIGTFAYRAWTAGDSLGEAVHVHLSDEDQLTSQWLVVTPQGHRATVTQVFTPSKGRMITRFDDEDAGWWAEEFYETDPPDLVEVPAGTYSDFSMSVRFRTADGFHLAKSFGPKDKAADQWFDEWVREAIEAAKDPIKPLPFSAAEALRFLGSLGIEGQGLGIAQSSMPIVDEASAGRQAPVYGDHWNEGEITGTSTPAIEALLARFKSERTKRAVGWAKEQLRARER